MQFQNIESILLQIDGERVEDVDQLEQFRIKYLGSKNIIKPLFAEMRNIEPSDKKAYGQAMNALKQKAEEKYASIKTSLQSSQKQDEADEMDLTRPVPLTNLGSRHPVSLVINKMIKIFTDIGFAVEEEREIEDDWHNFTAMNTPEDHPARDMQDTFYLKNSTEMLLRTHTSPVQARVMTTQEPPIRIIAPGRVYRNETISARSHCQFHQVEGLYVDKDVSFADMKQTLFYFAQALYGEEIKIRLRPSYFPFTEPSAEMDVYMGTDDDVSYRLTKGTGWLEVLGCGMVDPKVLENCGIDSTIYSGYAFGIGIERSALQHYDISDIRYLFENDIRFLNQFSGVR